MREPPGLGATLDSRWVLVLDNGIASDATETF
jgi:hypothetical protein